MIGFLGPQGVTVASWNGGRDPRQVYDMIPVADLGSTAAAGEQLLLRPQDDSLADPNLWPGSLPTPAPAVVFHEALSVAVIDQRGHSVSVSGRGLVSAPPQR